MNEDKVIDAKELVDKYMCGHAGANEVLEQVQSILNDALEPPEPERICGLTMDEWQVIIDGGFLCAYSDQKHKAIERAKEGKYLAILKVVLPSNKNNMFYDNVGRPWAFAMPYRAVGHVQPYFDNDECKTYLDGLPLDTDLLWHRVEDNHWHVCHGLDNLNWGGLDKFIVLDAGK